VSEPLPKNADDASCVGLDLGHLRTHVGLPAERGEQPEVLTLPTLIGYSRDDTLPTQFCCVGQRALGRRDHLQIVNPMLVDCPVDREEALRDYARGLRKLFASRWPEHSWGVVNCSVGASEKEARARRLVAGELFDRVHFADDTFLLAVGLDSLEVTSHSVVVDMGFRSTRAALICGGQPEAEQREEIDYGGAQLDATLAEAMGRRYPELALTDWTLSEIKEHFSFIAPAQRRATLELHYRGKHRRVDFTEVVEESCAGVLPPLMKVVRAVLAKCPSDDVEAFQRNIILAGGGAQMPGLVERLEHELRADGFEFATVRRPPTPGEAVVVGAARWAHVVPEREWGIPLFALG
jgi:actin-like ATPase involved in cell morphogenesis